MFKAQNLKDLAWIYVSISVRQKHKKESKALFAFGHATSGISIAMGHHPMVFGFICL
jgi:hypothetical protein